MKSHTDIVLIDDGEKGIINLNDMIPIAKENFDKLPNSNKLKQRCCNFKYLEKKIKEYK